MSEARVDDSMLLVNALREPESVRALDAQGWNALIAMARGEQLFGTLAHRLDGMEVPDVVRPILSDARSQAEYQRRSALWEADCARRALSAVDGKVVLLKGTAYAAARLDAAQGRSIGDLDILVAEAKLKPVEAALLAADWEWVKEDEYDDAYYRQWMHELPPLIHRTRDRMIDVHHTILPRTAKPKPDANAMIEAAVALIPVRQKDVRPQKIGGGAGLYVLAPADMLIHAIAHLFADGDMAGGLRNLWDIDQLRRQFADEPNFLHSLRLRARRHDLRVPVKRALRIAHHLYGTPIDEEYAGPLGWKDRLFVRRLLARDGTGRPTRKLTRLGFYIRGHLLRMPPKMLARHLWTKWRKGRGNSAKI